MIHYWLNRYKATHHTPNWQRVSAEQAARCLLAGLQVVLSSPENLRGLVRKGTAAPYPQPLGRGPAGRGLCRWCHLEVPKGRQRWCGDACVHEYKLMTDHQYARLAVWERDRGVCRLCGVDTLESKVYWDRLRHWASRAEGRPRHQPNQASRAAVAVGWPRDTYRDWWEMDHIVAQSRGGKHHLSNVRTLCVPCHKLISKLQSRRRAMSRRRSRIVERAGTTTKGPRNGEATTTPDKT